MKLKNVKLFLTDPVIRFGILSGRGFYNYMSDEKFLKKAFHKKMGTELDLEHPKTFNEKLQWLKLHNRKPEYTAMVDKYEVRKIIAEHIGEEYLIPILGVWEHFEDIDFEKLPKQFVLKCTHDSGGLVICKDKSKLALKKTEKKIKKSLATNYYDGGREWPYKNVPPRIIAEQYMTNEDGSGELTDYKFYCFNGEVKYILVCCERDTGNPKFYFFDTEWKLQRINYNGLDAPEGFTLPRPKCFDQMLEIAAKLSADIPFIRVDLYESHEKIYFGELTFFPQSGFIRNYLPETDRHFGELLDLSEAAYGKN